jgi:hypothetical protein
VSETVNPAKAGYVDNGWPASIDVHDGEHAVSEFAAPLVGALSPFGDTEFPMVPAPYVHPVTRINR